MKHRGGADVKSIKYNAAPRLRFRWIARVEPFITMSPLGSDNPRDLWEMVSGLRGKTGGDVLAIAHNGNLSNGRMFPILLVLTRPDGDSEKGAGRQRARLVAGSHHHNNRTTLGVGTG